MKNRESESDSVVHPKGGGWVQSSQLELSLTIAKSATVLSFVRSSPANAHAPSSEDASKRILDFAASLPDW